MLYHDRLNWASPVWNLPIPIYPRQPRSIWMVWVWMPKQASRKWLCWGTTPRKPGSRSQRISMAKSFEVDWGLCTWSRLHSAFTHRAAFLNQDVDVRTLGCQSLDACWAAADFGSDSPVFPTIYTHAYVRTYMYIICSITLCMSVSNYLILCSSHSIAYMHTYLHTHVDVYIHTWHAYMPARIHTKLHECRLACAQYACAHPCMHAPITRIRSDPDTHAKPGMCALYTCTASNHDAITVSCFYKPPYM